MIDFTSAARRDKTYGGANGSRLSIWLFLPSVASPASSISELSR